MTTVDFLWRGFNLTVVYEYSPGYAATREEPGEEPYYEITDIKLEGKDANFIFDDCGPLFQEIDEIIGNIIAEDVKCDQDYDPYYDDSNDPEF